MKHIEIEKSDCWMKLDWGCKWNALVLAHQQFIQHSIFENVLYARSANERPAHSTNRYTCIKYKRAQKKEHSLTFGLQNSSRISNEFINSRKKERKWERAKKLNVLFVWLTHAAFVYGIFPAEKCAQSTGNDDSGSVWLCRGFCAISPRIPQSIFIPCSEMYRVR